MYRQFFVLAVTVIAMTVSPSAHAQTEKGKFVIGESIGFCRSSQHSKSQGNGFSAEQKGSSTNFRNSVSVGYLLTSRLEAGLGSQVEFSSNKSESISADVSRYANSSVSNSIGPYLRYSHPIAEKLFFFGNINLQYKNTNNTSTNFSNSSQSKSTSQNKSFSSSFYPGFTYFVCKRIGIELAIGEILFSKYLKNSASTNSDLWVNFNLSNVTLGGRIYL